MVDPNTINDYSRVRAACARDESGRLNVRIRFPDYLYNEILAEAQLRGWSFARMVRHLCEASIEGIE